MSPWLPPWSADALTHSRWIGGGDPAQREMA